MSALQDSVNMGSAEVRLVMQALTLECSLSGITLHSGPPEHPGEAGSHCTPGSHNSKRTAAICISWAQRLD